MGVVAVRAALAEAGHRRPATCRRPSAVRPTEAWPPATGSSAALAGTGIPIYDVEAGCASGGAALQLAAASIASGQHDRVLVFGIEKMPKGIIRSSFFAPWQEAAGLSPAPAYFALRAQRLLADTGLTVEHLAQVVVKNRRQRGRQSRRHVPQGRHRRRGPGGPDDLPAAHLVHALLAQRGRRRRGPRASHGNGVRLAGISLRSHLPGNVLGEDSPLCGIDDTAITPPTTLAADDAYAQAGLGPDDIDVVECQDTDAARELLAWAELGLCAPGGQAAILAEGDALIGGRLPINPSGGLLSKGEPLGASALGQVVELVRQLRGTAGARQVEGPRVGLAHVIGRGANACVTVLVQ